MVKSCTRCNKSKNLSEFHNNKNSKDGKTARCKMCAIEIACDYVQKNKSEVVRKKKERRRDIRKSLYESAQSRARERGLVFNLTVEDIVVPEYCPILGLKLEKAANKAKPNSPSLDRILPELGYTKDNVQVISYKANAMKNNATTEELISFAKWVFDKLNKGE